MAPRSTSADGPPRIARPDLPPRGEEELRDRQRRGVLRVRVAADFRRLVGEVGLAEAYANTDVVVAAEATFTDQASLVLNLGPTDPPIRPREPQIDGVAALAGGAGSDLVLAVGGARASATAAPRRWAPCWLAAASN